MEISRGDPRKSCLEGVHDDLLCGFASNHESVDDLLDSFFSFLRRRTDFFHVRSENDEDKSIGFVDGAAEAKVQKVFLKHQQLYQRGSGSMGVAPAKNPTRSIPPVLDASSGMKNSISLKNGGACISDGYYWNQSDKEVNVEVVLGVKSSELRKGEVVVNIERKRGKVWSKLRDRVYFEGEWYGEVINSECSWVMDSVNGISRVMLYLWKATPDVWWDCVLTNSTDKIDLKKIEATKNLSDMDPESQQVIKRLIREENEKRQGHHPSGDALPLIP